MMDVLVGASEYWKPTGGIAKGQGAAPLARALGGRLPFLLLGWGGEQLLGRGWCSTGAGGQRVGILPLGGMLQGPEPLLFSPASKDSMERYGSNGITP